MKRVHSVFSFLVALLCSGCIITEKKDDAPEQPKAAVVETAKPSSSETHEKEPEIPEQEASTTNNKPSATGDDLSVVRKPDDMAYNLGRTLGEHTVQGAWKNLSQGNDCSKVEQLAKLIARSSGRIMDQAQSLQSQDKTEYAEGYVHGLRAGLAAVAAQCNDQCSALCKAANQASQAVLCTAAQIANATITLSHSAQLPSLQCNQQDCELPPEKVALGDCP